MDAPGAAQILFEIGGGLLIFGGAMHACMTIYDVRRPTFFTPTSDRVRRQMEGPTIGFRRLFPGGDRDSPSIWRAWLGFNISHGLGLLAFGLLCLLLAAHDFEFVRDTGFLFPVVTGISAAYLALSPVFWFYGPIALLGLSTACFTLAWILA